LLKLEARISKFETVSFGFRASDFRFLP